MNGNENVKNVWAVYNSEIQEKFLNIYPIQLTQVNWRQWRLAVGNTGMFTAAPTLLLVTQWQWLLVKFWMQMVPANDNWVTFWMEM